METRSIKHVNNMNQQRTTNLVSQKWQVGFRRSGFGAEVVGFEAEVVGFEAEIALA